MMAAYAPAIGSSSSAPTADQQSSAAQIVQWLRGKWGDFLALDPQIEDLQHRAAVVGAQALQQGDTNTNQLAKDSISRLADLRQTFDRAQNIFASISNEIPSFQGLGALPIVPIALVATVLILGAMVTYVFSRVSAEQQIVQLLEAGRLTPDQAQNLLDKADKNPSGTQSLADVLKWIAVGLLGFMALKTLHEVVT